MGPMTVTNNEQKQAAQPVVVGWLAVAGAVGAAVMSVAHWGVAVPLVADVGRVVAPVAVALAVGAVLYAVVAVGSFGRRRWAWTAGVVVNALALLSTASPPFRGPVELVAAAVSLAALVVLLSRRGREAFGR
jgi:hypothetical protein